MHKVVASYPKSRSRKVAILGLLAALPILILVLVQLFGFEELPGILGYFWGIDESVALLLAAILVVLEVFALPALLGMKLSPLMRRCSAIAGVVVAGYWIVASFHIIFSSLARDSGVFGGRLEGMSSLLLPVVSLLLAALLWVYWMSIFDIKLPDRKKNTPKE